MIMENAALENEQELVKTDITMLVIEARGWAGRLMRREARRDGDSHNAYNKFIELFFQLYISFKHNASFTNKLKDWDKKEPMYDDMFYVSMMRGDYAPKSMLLLFDVFLKDIIATGIYNLSMGEFMEREISDAEKT